MFAVFSHFLLYLSLKGLQNPFSPLSMATIKVSTFKVDKNNPRKISRADMETLKNSIRDFPKMMELRPIIIDKTNKVLAGRQRLEACKELGMEEIPSEWVKKASDLTEEERQRFIVMETTTQGPGIPNCY